MDLQTSPSRKPLDVSRGERLLVCWLACTFLLCVFVALPNELTLSYRPLQRAVRSYLRTLGVDQYWKMFAGEDWDIPQLRIIAIKDSGVPTDVTPLFLHQEILYRHVLDDHVGIAHIVLARGGAPQLLASYAGAVRARLGPDVREIRFEQVFRAARIRAGSGEPAAVVPLAVYRSDATKSGEQKGATTIR
jgi:hypothetical protein